MNKLIVAEKPSVALRIALSLGQKPKTNYFNGIRYYEIDSAEGIIYVVAAAGHLFTIKAKSNGQIPIFDIEWIASYKTNKESYYTKKYLDAIESIGRKCSFFINACDYDIEGTVIGTNIIRFITNNGDVNKAFTPGNVKRMRFSTTTTQELAESYAHLNDFDSGNFEAGEARHMLDWYWGINLSRALMRAISAKGVKKTLSIGRVQGPTLGILSKREIEIKNFVPKPYWKVGITAKGTAFENSRGEIFDKKLAEDVYEKTKSGTAVVKSVERHEKPLYPFPPFDLTSLQLEVNRVHRIDPTRTLAIAQSLYERSYISYPRTSSQKLPQTLNLPRIIGLMAKMDKYRELAERLASEKRFRPVEGSKADEAHPAIYPTGELPQKMSEEEEKVYDVIARRFLSCFADRAILDESKVIINVGSETYSARGDTIRSNGWLDYYPYYKPRTSEMPHFDAAERLPDKKAWIKEQKTIPPKRYTKASLISLLESKDLGTKATRTEIIDTLFRREYIKGMSIEVTGFGMSVYNALSKYCAPIVEEDLTRKLEKDMEEITVGKLRKDEVIDEGRQIITGIIGEFSKNEAGIGEELMKGLKESETQGSIGKCPKCGEGVLVLRRSRMGKNFIGCSNYPKCTNTYSVPQGARIVPLGKVCEICHTPRIKVFRRDRKVFEMDLDPSCPTKKDWQKPEYNKATELSTVKENRQASGIEKQTSAKSRKVPVGETDSSKKLVEEATAAATTTDKETPNKKHQKRRRKGKMAKSKSIKAGGTKIEADAVAKNP